MDPLESTSALVICVAAIVILSNILGNVPVVIMMQPMMKHLALIRSPEHVNAAWLILSFVICQSGNALLTGSAVNLIVAQQAEAEIIAHNDRMVETGHLNKRKVFGFLFKEHAKFGLPLTILTTAAGVSVLYLELMVWKWKI